MKKLIAALTIFLFLCSALGIGPETFRKSRFLIQRGEKSKMVDVVIVFEKDSLEFRERGSRYVLKHFEYKNIKSAEYSHSKHPRWKSGAAAFLPLGVFALPIFFMKGKKHWLTIQAQGDYAILKLDKKNYKFINAAFGGHTGVKVTFEDLQDE